MESAYRIIPIHLNDRYLLGMQWQANYMVMDMALFFGLRSAPYISSSVSDLVEWVLKKQYDELSPSLSGRFPHPGSSHVSDVPTEPRHLYPIIPVLGDSLSPWQVGGPFYSPYCFRNRPRFSKKNLIVSTHSWSPGHKNAIAHERSWIP